jgi:hypothetical protein
MQLWHVTATYAEWDDDGRARCCELRREQPEHPRRRDRRLLASRLHELCRPRRQAAYKPGVRH